MNKEISYEQAIDCLETIAQQLERGEMPIDEMATRLREAQDDYRYLYFFSKKGQGT